MAFGKIEIKVVPDVNQINSRFDMLNLSLNRQIAGANRVLANRSVEIIKQSMKDAGIKRQSGQLFDSIKVARADSRGYTITMSKLAAILNFGRPDGYPIKSKQDHDLLANPATGFIVSTKKEPIEHRIKPHPWMVNAQEKITQLTDQKLRVFVDGTIKRTWMRKG